MEYSTKPFTKDSIVDFLMLYKAVYGKSISAEIVLKKFDTTYLIEGHFGYFAYDNKKPIAFYGVVPTLMKYKNQTEIAAQSVNTMTHPDYTGKGLFTELAKLTYVKAAKAGITFIWGFPNQNSAYGFLNKLGWSSNENMIGFKIKISELGIQKKIQKFPLINTIHRFYLKKVFSKYITSQFPNENFHEHHVTVSKTKEYFSYKAYSDNFVIKIDNCIFWVKIKNSLEIGDIDAPTKTDFHKALNKLKRICKKTRISEILFQVSPDTEYWQWMENEKTEKFDSWPICYKNLASDFPLENLKFTLGDIDIF